MKTLKLLMVALVAAAASYAQNSPTEMEYSPTVYLIAAQAIDSVYLTDCDDVANRAMQNRIAIRSAKMDYRLTHREGFQQAGMPNFIFATKNNRFSFAMGGFINLRSYYDLDGMVDNIDFVSADIPIPGNYATQQRIGMDASTSRLYFKAILNSQNLGPVVFYIDTDFRGGTANSYTPRIRSAYVSFLGFTFGRDVTTFCDLKAAPNTIDFQGPNAYNFEFNTMIRYEHFFFNDHLKVGVAAEVPKVSGSYNDNFAPIPQRVPDFPVFAEYCWGNNRQSHFRASAVFRNVYYENMEKENTETLFGWGVQASGHIKTCRFFDLYFNGVYGQGISPYIQDLQGAGLDFTPNPQAPTQMQTMPMFGWQAAGEINFTDRLSLNGGYSMVQVQKENGYYAEDEYRRGQYIFGNIFYKLTPSCSIAAEYLYGTRKNMNEADNHANRINAMIQYNF